MPAFFITLRHRSFSTHSVAVNKPVIAMKKPRNCARLNTEQSRACRTTSSSGKGTIIAIRPPRGTGQCLAVSAPTGSGIHLKRRARFGSGPLNSKPGATTRLVFNVTNHDKLHGKSSYRDVITVNVLMTSAFRFNQSTTAAFG